MIDKKISVSEQVADLAVEAQLIFTWSIPHSDDFGLLPSSYRTLKAVVVPMWDMSMETFGNHMDAIIKQGLYKKFTHNKTEYIHITRFAKHQTLKRDRKPNTLLSGIQSWDEMEALGFHLEYTGIPSKEKRSKVKITEASKRSQLQVLKNFEFFWVQYPNKTAKKKALQSWLKINPEEGGILFSAIMKGLNTAKRSSQWTESGGKYIPHPTTWLNQERWNDEGSKVAKKKSDSF